MKDTLSKLKKTAFDEIVKASHEYVLREQVRTELSDFVASRIKKGDVNTQEDLDALLRAMKVAVAMLESISFESWKAIEDK